MSRHTPHRQGETRCRESSCRDSAGTEKEPVRWDANSGERPHEPEWAAELDSAAGIVYRILVVDDNPVSRESMAAYLGSKGLAVEQASGGLEAVAHLRAKPVDLVVLDVVMPSVNGLELLKFVRHNWSLTELPVVMATGKTDSDDMVEAFELGANDYITKPIDLRVAHARILAQLRSMESRGSSSGPSWQDELTPGTILDDKYRIEEMIGKGAFGIVYRATHLHLEQGVAIKMLRSTAIHEGNVFARFKQEGRSLTRLEHPNTVKLHDLSWTENGRPYLVMELLDGHSLADELRRGPLDAERAGEILLPVLSALDAAHSRGIIHRDIKPHNIFLHRGHAGEVVKVLDFGLARLFGESMLIESITVDGMLIGTPAYMAPERLDGDGEYDGRTDVFSVAIVLFEMVCGERPFQSRAGSLLDLISRHLKGDPTPLRDNRPDLPEALESLILQALDKDYRRRPTCREFAERFASILEVSPFYNRAAKEDPSSPPDISRRTGLCA